MHYIKPILPFLLATLFLYCLPQFKGFIAVNLAVQLCLFIFVACIPAYRTKRMSYVDIAWPLGLIALGVLLYALGEGNAQRTTIVSTLYVLMGLRMAVGGITFLFGSGLKAEFPRYIYQRRRWQHRGLVHTDLIMQIEILVQAFANVTFLVLPGLLIAFNPEQSIHWLEWLGLGIWVAAFVWESIADRQKLQFVQEMKRQSKSKQVCNVGLWKFTRHPNYFGEWMAWNGLVVMALPSLVSYYSQLSILAWLVLAGCLLFTSWLMFTCLVYATGAKPAEFYSAQKRPDYKEYQRTTNMFFPGKQKK